MDLHTLRGELTAPKPRPCIVARWAAGLDEDNQHAFDDLIERARTGELAVQRLWRGLVGQGLEASAASFDRHIRRICACRNVPTVGETE